MNEKNGRDPELEMDNQCWTIWSLCVQETSQQGTSETGNLQNSPLCFPNQRTYLETFISVQLCPHVFTLLNSMTKVLQVVATEPSYPPYQPL